MNDLDLDKIIKDSFDVKSNEHDFLFFKHRVMQALPEFGHTTFRLLPALILLCSVLVSVVIIWLFGPSFAMLQEQYSLFVLDFERTFSMSFTSTVITALGAIFLLINYRSEINWKF